MRQVQLSRLALLASSLVWACSIDFTQDTPPSGGTGVIDDDADPEDDCCVPHEGADCENPILSDCVCEADPSCCEETWTESCVALVEELGCGQCGPPGTCCEVRDSVGCEVPAIEECVCVYDPACCRSGWDEQCVADVFLFGCGMCPGISSCCVADGAPGCNDASVQACVCLEDPACCATNWDFQCVQQVEALGCGVCSGANTSGGD